MATTKPTADITIAGKPRKSLHINLVGIEYDIRVPKAGFAISMAMRARSNDEDAAMNTMDDLNEWIRRAFKDSADSVIARLSDDDDDLDLGDITELMQQSIAAASENPTS